MSNQPVIDSVNEPTNPFGLPLGSVRGLMSLLICGFFWIVLLWPDEMGVRPLLGHFFMLALVLMAFASAPAAYKDGETSRLIPWVLRFLFVGGSIAVVLFCMFQHPDRLQTRLTPNVEEFKNWWGPFLATTFGGFAGGLFLRFILGRSNPIFQTIRAWLSVVALMMMVTEIGLFVMFTTAENKPDEFMRYWQAIELALVSAYFGTRA